MLENKKNYAVDIKNYSDRISHIAIQGPQSINIINNLGMKFPETFKFIYHEIEVKNVITGNNDIIISGTGYTGEKGVELVVPNQIAEETWESILKEVKKIGGMPCGLGARDTLRMEKGMLLSGQDFNENKNPYEASISFIVNFDHEFIGKEELLKQKKRIQRYF